MKMKTLVSTLSLIAFGLTSFTAASADLQPHRINGTHGLRTYDAIGTDEAGRIHFIGTKGYNPEYSAFMFDLESETSANILENVGWCNFQDSIPRPDGKVVAWSCEHHLFVSDWHETNMVPSALPIEFSGDNFALSLKWDVDGRLLRTEAQAVRDGSNSDVTYDLYFSKYDPVTERVQTFAPVKGFRSIPFIKKVHQNIVMLERYDSFIGWINLNETSPALKSVKIKDYGSKFDLRGSLGSGYDISPDGRSIVLFHSSMTHLGQAQLSLVALSSTGIKTMPIWHGPKEESAVYRVSWSPDSQYVNFSREFVEQQHFETLGIDSVTVYRAATGAVAWSKSASENEGKLYSSPEFFPDGTMLLAEKTSNGLQMLRWQVDGERLEKLGEPLANMDMIRMRAQEGNDLRIIAEKRVSGTDMQPNNFVYTWSEAGQSWTQSLSWRSYDTSFPIRNFAMPITERYIAARMHFGSQQVSGWALVDLSGRTIVRTECMRAEAVIGDKVLLIRNDQTISTGCNMADFGLWVADL